MSACAVPSGHCTFSGVQGGLLGSGMEMLFEEDRLFAFLDLELFMEPVLERDDRMDPAMESVPSVLARSPGMASCSLHFVLPQTTLLLPKLLLMSVRCDFRGALSCSCYWCVSSPRRLHGQL
jgi:hypothetical protein